MAKKTKGEKKVETLTHEEAKRRNIPTAEMQSFAEQHEDAAPEEVRYLRDTPLEPGTHRERNRDLDPQLVWKGKDEQDWSDLVTVAPPLYIQEKVHPKAIIDDLKRRSKQNRQQDDDTPDLFADFNGLDDPEAKTEFYAHEQNWTNRMILGDSLQVMASLAEKEQLRGQVQCIYIDPPYGIRFNSNWQVSTRSRDVKDGKIDQISREPEQVRAFRDTWSRGIHSYLTYLRDRLTVSRDLLSETGSLFVQIGDENVHRVRSLLDEIFGSENFVSQINFKSMGALGQGDIPNVYDYILWYAKDRNNFKFRPLYKLQEFQGDNEYRFVSDVKTKFGYKNLARTDSRPSGEEGLFRRSTLTSSGFTPSCMFNFEFQGQTFKPFGNKSWRTNLEGMERLKKANRIFALGGSLYFKRYANDSRLIRYENSWTDAPAASEKIYVVQTAPKFIERCVLMTTDPGDIVLDPTSGSGTTAVVGEEWARRWIVVDTSRVALALTRARLMGRRFPYYLLKDTEEGKEKEFEETGRMPSAGEMRGDVRHGFVYRRVPYVRLKDVANNKEIDSIWEKWRPSIEGCFERIREWKEDIEEEYQVPEECPGDAPQHVKNAVRRFWESLEARQKEVDDSIARHSEQEVLYDQPYEDSGRVRVAGPFTVESLSPHRVVPGDERELWDEVGAVEGGPRSGGESAQRGQRRPDEWDERPDFAQIVLDHLKLSGVQQSSKEERIEFTSLTPWPGDMIAADGRFMEGETERKAAIFVGPEFGTVARADLVRAAREASEAGFDLLIACAFNYDAHATDFDKLGPIRVIRARMNPDLHMADELKNTGSGNLFVVFGEPDVDIDHLEDGQLQVRIRGLDIFDPQKGEVRAGGTEDIAAWFIDTDYNEESFFVRHAYFLGAQDPYKSLKTALKAEIDEEAWSTLYRDVSRPFPRPDTGRIAVKVINHFGDEVMQVFDV
ncbi:site-specific DNA-methyltransferase [Rhodovibrio sodomensis]|uniref:site-specific DNA-methyltransferase (adenine-specific) n=1 Tax=Rhodovibrio sodomensis TaxID=1088 RepID=A0ABS1DHG2_9PROT|nr:site-specific DNA-methyltransferase [Rhodovibrio sodomensis]MBK1669289.1 site-specific DNA-methyltransferase [Rhodovibrio sodomensis]